jgi:Stage II sporulation protein E (SpoIIE)
MNPASPFGGPDAGGMHGPPVLGLASTVQLLQASETGTELHAFFGSFLRVFLCLLVAPLALWAWLVNRQERAWLWLFLALAWLVVSSTIVDSSNFTTAIRAKEVYWLQVPELPFWILFWWQWFRLRDRRWIPRAAWLLAAAITLLNFCAWSPDLDFHFIPLAALHGFYAASLWVTVPYVLLLLVILVEGYRRDRTETLWAALPLLLYVYNRFANYLENVFHIRSWFFPFGLGINTGDILYMLMIAVIGVLSLRRFLRNQVRDSLIRETEKQDLEQAQQLQQRVLVPDAFHSPAFSIESEYRPALIVGGDFYQTLSRPDGSLVLVIGDVSGKGISAAMLVAVLVGAIRSQAEHSSDPSEMLAMLNRRMIGRAGGHFATCLAAEISPSGILRIANAGHISPYRNGEDLDLEGSLPLGITDDVAYSTQTFTLAPGDRLTFLTDGVPEATNPARELFGFDRTRDISNQPAATVMDHVLTFGQEDDITILGIQFATT